MGESPPTEGLTGLIARPGSRRTGESQETPRWAAPAGGPSCGPRIGLLLLLTGIGLHGCTPAPATAQDVRPLPETTAIATASPPEAPSPVPPTRTTHPSPAPGSAVTAGPSPTLRTSEVGEGVLFVKVLGDLLVVGNDQGTLSFLDISDPSRPRLLVHIPLGREEYLTVEGFREDLPVTVRDADVRDEIMFVISVTTLFAFDISDPSNPIELARSELSERLNDMQIRGSEIWIAIADTIGDLDRLLVVDASDPSLPLLVGEADFQDTVAGRIRLAGDLAYVTARGQETAPDLRLFTIGDPAHPTEVRSIAGLPAFRAWVQGSVAYIATGRYVRRQPVGIYTEASSVAVVSVSDPQDPQALGYIWTLQLATDLFAVADDVFIIGDKFPGSGDMVLTMWFSVADLRDPTQPLVNRTLRLEGLGEALAYRGGYAYIAAGSAGIHIVSATAAVLIDTLTLEELYGR